MATWYIRQFWHIVWDDDVQVFLYAQYQIPFYLDVEFFDMLDEIQILDENNHFLLSEKKTNWQL